MAPELLELRENKQDKGVFSPEKADVFSLGMVFLQLLTLRSLEGLNPRSGNLRMMSIVDTVKYSWAKKLLEPMLNVDYKERPKFKDCLKFVDVAQSTLTYHEER